MKLFVVGINHKTAPVQVRERLAFAPKDIIDANRSLKQQSWLEEGLILSTCNRVEIYAVGNSLNRDYIQYVKDFLSKFHKIDLSDFEDRLYVYQDEDTIKHLYTVAAGLDSMVVGEMEILGQVKKAYQDAVKSKTAGKILNRLLQNSFNTAKKIRTDTSICRGSVSVSSVAVNLAKKILGDLSNKRALVIGAGTIGEKLIAHLKENGINTILVANRTIEKAQELAANFGATAVRFEDFIDSLVDTDIVITSTGAPHCIIRKQDFSSLMPKRSQKPLFFIDVAVPRDAEVEVGAIDNVYLYDIDDLTKISDKNLALRQNELDNCNGIISAATKKFIEWVSASRKRNG